VQQWIDAGGLRGRTATREGIRELHRFQPEGLRARVMSWADEQVRLNKLPAKAGNVLGAVLYRGELPRGDVGEVIGTSDRHARRLVAVLMDRHVLVSERPRAPLRIAFPAALASRWIPGLFPEKIGD
jgi:hypothetical protein